MTVKQLIEALQKMPQGHKMVVTQRSEFVELDTVDLIEIYDNGGYFSRVYDARGRERAFGAVFVNE